MTNLPHRFRESAFRTYETHIATAVRYFPEVYIIHPGDLSTVTFSCRMRDAIRSLIEHGWSTKEVNLVKLSECYGELQVAEYNGKVLTGRHDKLAGYRTAEKATSTNVHTVEDENTTTLTISSTEEAKFLAYLAQLGCLKPMKLYGITPDTVEYLNQNYDIYLEPTADGGHLLK